MERYPVLEAMSMSSKTLQMVCQELHATCIREEVEPLEDHIFDLEARLELKDQENAKLRAFIDKFIPSECWGIDAFDGGEVQDVAVEMGILVKVDHAQPCKVEQCNCEGSDYLYYTAWTAP